MPGRERSGSYVAQPGGYSAFIPRPLPPKPSLDLNRLLPGLSRADQAVGRLDGATRLLPDIDLFLAMYVRREALLSSQIEGTDCTLDDILAFELDTPTSHISEVDVQEVVNYVRALNFGLERLQSLPLSSRLLREVHAILLAVGRGSDRSPGEFRVSQNWIGPPGCTLSTAAFVPPPPDEMQHGISELERYIYSTIDASAATPLLIVSGLVHAQFETLHPFMDGNGRIGRLLITLLLCERSILNAPVLYLSTYFKRNRTEYFDRLMNVRLKGEWEEWLGFFLRGIEGTANEAAATAQKIHLMRESHRDALEVAGGTLKDIALLDKLFSQPLINAKWVSAAIDVTPPTANAIVTRFVKLGLLRETTGGKRNRIFRYDHYLALFDKEVTEVASDRTEADRCADPT
ncbi:MAG TPA: Fic family protein [Acidimicrobiales bacterium]|nr:Fic family protein [Acidimicrobiales bacterium]